MHLTNWQQGSRKYRHGLLLASLMMLSACGLFTKTVVKEIPGRCEIPTSLTAPIAMPPPLEVGATNGQLWQRKQTLEVLLDRCNSRLQDVQAWQPKP